MTLTLLVLVSLAVYRGTLLVTGDRITRTPRRRLREWLHHRAHHLTTVEAWGEAAYRCSCGWRAESAPSGALRMVVVHGTTHDLIPRGSSLPDYTLNPHQAAQTVAEIAVRHVQVARDRGRLTFLLECPWCVSIYLGGIGAAVAAAWPAGWWRWPALAMAASGVTGLLATIAAPDENDQED